MLIQVNGLDEIKKIKLTDHFTGREIMCKCGCHTLIVDDRFMDKVEDLRIAIGLPLYVVSGYRCLANTEKLIKNPEGSARSYKGSAHCLGLAVDLRTLKRNYDLIKFFEQAVLLFPRVGIYNWLHYGTIHVDCKFIDNPRMNIPLYWTYMNEYVLGKLGLSKKLLGYKYFSSPETLLAQVFMSKWKGLRI